MVPVIRPESGNWAKTYNLFVFFEKYHMMPRFCEIESNFKNRIAI